ncbi:MAG: AAA family ATPase [Candidatus Latescibacteria bacterium]|nr:AAA family ATPase [Candidatus Latescibacterota bacterium]
MIDLFRAIYYRLIDELDVAHYRYLYDTFEVNARLVGLVGPRGVGKTTLLLQFIRDKVKDRQKAFYLSADHIYFNKITLFEFVQELYETDAVELIFIDEIHKYKNWNQELKNIYDAFPRIKVVFSGSSNIDLVEGTHDLSRRAVLYYMRGLSFREYLNFTTNSKHDPVSLNDLMGGHVELAAQWARIPRLRGHFSSYLQEGYYPFVFEPGGHFYSKLGQVIDKTVFEDIAHFYNLKTANLIYFKKILYFLTTIPPGRLNIHNLANNLGIDDKTTAHYIRILQATGLTRLLFADQRGSRLLRKPEKAYLNNTTLLHAVGHDLGQAPDIGAVRELFFLSAVEDAGQHAFYSRDAGDFRVGDWLFEVGGPQKTRHQVKHRENAFVVKDGVLQGGRSTIPLHAFGFLY